jgi:C1A family cysteine protease
MGWIPDYPDLRDYTPDHVAIGGLLKTSRLARLAAGKAAVPSATDLRPWCSPVEDQGELGSCTANAGVGVLEYFARRAFGRHIDASRLFLYKVTRNLMRATGDTGAYLRTTMGAMALFGVPPEEHWPYRPSDYDREPSAFCYAFASCYQALRYFRLDPPSARKELLLARIKAHLAAGIPAMFGFTVYASIDRAESTGEIPFPGKGERVRGGHAVVAVGYDDGKRIPGAGKGAETVGALLVRNSWGAGWGAGGYGFLPYAYVLEGLAVDWWSVLSAEWIDTGEFGP